MALVSVSDAAAVIGCARNSVYRKIRLGELDAVDGPSGLLIELDGLRDRWRRISRVRSDSPCWMVSKADEPPHSGAAVEETKIRQRISEHPRIGTPAHQAIWKEITAAVNLALKDENIYVELTPDVVQEAFCTAEPLVFDRLPLEHSQSPEFALEYGWI
jgi:hypothetical protein